MSSARSSSPKFSQALALPYFSTSHHFHASSKQALAQRLSAGTFRGLGVLAEELQVLAVIENIEELLVLPWPEQVWAQPRAATHHLPEFRLRPHQLEKHQVDDFGDVDSRVQ